MKATDIQAAIGVAQLKKTDLMLNKREKIARRYNKVFKDTNGVTVPFIEKDRKSAWHLYVIKLEPKRLRISRSRFIAELKKIGINASVHFIPLYRHPFYEKTFGYSREQFPNSEWIFKRMVSLPIYPSMKREETEKVIDAVRNVLQRYKR